MAVAQHVDCAGSAVEWLRGGAVPRLRTHAHRGHPYVGVAGCCADRLRLPDAGCHRRQARQAHRCIVASGAAGGPWMRRIHCLFHGHCVLRGSQVRRLHEHIRDTDVPTDQHIRVELAGAAHRPIHHFIRHLRRHRRPIHGDCGVPDAAGAGRHGPGGNGPAGSQALSEPARRRVGDGRGFLLAHIPGSLLVHHRCVVGCCHCGGGPSQGQGQTPGRRAPVLVACVRVCLLCVLHTRRGVIPRWMVLRRVDGPFRHLLPQGTRVDDVQGAVCADPVAAAAVLRHDRPAIGGAAICLAASAGDAPRSIHIHSYDGPDGVGCGLSG
mmetsp:Transcript_23061/g.57009  ORF Transcript_23061/g.57009 Transcript_23061/m.57009 type:complete len:324 (-) Transcript_23061:332-1303(-)